MEKNTMKQEFIDFLNALMAAAPQIVEEKMTPNIQAYIDTLSEGNIDKPELTDNGKVVLKFLQENTDKVTYKARDIADGLCISSRGVSGSLRKLVNDGFVEKLGTNPAIYSITEKGKNYIIEE
jgi:DNA-binding MarR family transcriptional regulator